MSALSTFLTQHRRSKSSVHTHTWFGGGASPQTLTILTKDVTKLLELLIQDAQATPVPVSDSPRCVTEKVTRGKPFRFFADLDFQASSLANWPHASDETFLLEVQQKLRDLVQLYHQTVCEATKSPDVEMIMTTRLPYKIHMHFPSVIVDTDGAKALAAMFDRRFQDEFADIYGETVSDVSVYTTGLRMLYCHKGSMAKPDKKEAEKKEHQRLFPSVPYCDVYYVTDVETWTQDTVPSLADLSRTSIQAAADAVLAVLATGSKGKGKRAASSEAKGKGNVVKRVTAKEDQSLAAASQVLISFLANASSIAQHDIQMDKWDVRGSSLIVPTRSRICPFAKREHNGNQQYFVVTHDSAEQRCHDDQCDEIVRYPFQSALIKAAVTDLFNAARLESGKLDLAKDNRERMPAELDTELEAEDSIETNITDEMRFTALSETIRELEQRPEVQRMNLTHTVSDISPSTVGGAGSYICELPQNRYCAICEREHDTSQNCILASVKSLTLDLLCKMDLRKSISVPLGSNHGNIIFGNQIINNSVNITLATPPDGDIRDFGPYDNFPKIHDDSVINQLCYKSLAGTTCDVAKYAIALMKDKYAFQDGTWYWFCNDDGYWRADITPDDLLTGDVCDGFGKLLDVYTAEKPTRWLRSLRNDLCNINRRKGFIEDMERQVQKGARRLPLGDKTHLVGFQNGVYDSFTCEFRAKRPEDYLTILIPYDIPSQVDHAIRNEILQVLSDIMPTETTRRFLLTMLALHLEGINRHDIAMVWTGVGGNGKGFLKGLMEKAFGPLHREPPATFLTSERPAADRPNADLMDVKAARSLFTSEPQAGRKINSGFLKFITGRDTIRIRNVHSPTFVEYVPRFLVTLLCNVIPLIEGGDEDIRGIWRRLKIIHFGTIFTSNPRPDRANERLADPMLGDKSATWGPHFMLLLMEVFSTYVQNGRRIEIPHEIEAALEEQRDENNPFDVWLNDNLISASGTRMHFHRLEREYNKTNHTEKIRPALVTRKLQARGIDISPVGKNCPDLPCCTSITRYISNYSLA